MTNKQKTLCQSRRCKPIHRLMITDLPDILLTEILARVDSHKCALTCKLVCKQWYSLTSCPDFVSRFITNHVVHDQDHQKHSLIVLSIGTPVGGGPVGRWDRCISFIGSPDLESAWTHSTSKNFAEKSGCVHILASNNDLLVCQFKSWMYMRDNTCFVHNPFTMEWFRLPSAPSTVHAMAITCDPYYRRDTQGRHCLRNSGRRFKILCIGDFFGPGGWLHKGAAFYYCSERRRWSNATRLENRFYLPCTNFVAYQGKFYWASELAGLLVVYDPSGAAGSEKRLCEFPAVESCWGKGSRLVRLGVSQGSLRMMRIFWLRNLHDHDHLDHGFTLCVWELMEDGEHDKVIWRLKHSVRSDDMSSSQNSCLQSDPKSKVKLLEFDPVDEEIVYLDLCGCIVSCNLRTRNLEVVSEPPSHFRRDPPFSNMVFPLAHPWWPAPLFS
ncbi:hypothetical protein Tsubulata_037617 [Turnera subulata]|uniref:F-box domain-containing protein n=1 Tax=Turnera subulata TaxID=218843 RepID=A0A9Q0J8F0_9ROSI|nr:hypothetical protein Tsubulata_037617 [Turnera subulata]